MFIRPFAILSSFTDYFIVSVTLLDGFLAWQYFVIALVAETIVSDQLFLLANDIYSTTPLFMMTFGG